MQEESEILHLFSFLFSIFADNMQILLAYDQETTSITICLYIPNVGTLYSQRGNVMFPTWEHYAPNMGISLFVEL